MTRTTLSTLSALILLSACGDADAPAEEASPNGEVAAESDFDQELSNDEANAALDALDAEEAAPVTE